MKEKLIKIVSQIKGYFVSTVLFRTISFLLMIIGIISALFISITIKLWTYSINTSPEGFEEFLDIFGFPIKAFAGALALFTIYITLRRMKVSEDQLQTSREQIQLITEQNRISNYFKFRDEFVKHFEVSYFHKFFLLWGDEDKNPLAVYYPLFNAFYGSQKKFNGNLIESMLKEIELFYSETSHFKYIKSKSTDVTKKEDLLFFFYESINKWENTITAAYFGITFNMASKFVGNIEQIAKENNGIWNSAFTEIMELYFNIILLSEVVAFAGIDFPFPGKVMASINFLLHLFKIDHPSVIIKKKS